MSNTFGIGDLAAMGLANVGLGPLSMSNMLETAELVRKAWSSFGVPSNFAPTIDLQELDRRIGDLKAVEQWLTVNMNMLKGSIQALEIQRGTIATLQAFGSALTSPAMAAAGAASSASATASTSPGGATAREAAAPDSAPQRADDDAVPPSFAAGWPPQAPEAAEPDDEASAEPTDQTTDQSAERESAADAQTDPALISSAWWNMLQNQFNQVAAAALSGVGLPSSALSGTASQGSGSPAAGRKEGSAGRKRAGAKRATPKRSAAKGIATQGAGTKRAGAKRTVSRGAGDAPATSRYGNGPDAAPGAAPTDDPRPARKAGHKR